jgi:hypothetical protein
VRGARENGASVRQQFHIARTTPRAARPRSLGPSYRASHWLSALPVGPLVTLRAKRCRRSRVRNSNVLSRSGHYLGQTLRCVVPCADPTHRACFAAGARQSANGSEKVNLNVRALLPDRLSGSGYSRIRGLEQHWAVLRMPWALVSRAFLAPKFCCPTGILFRRAVRRQCCCFGSNRLDAA